MILVILTTSCESMIEVDLPENKINEKDVYQNINTTKAVLSTIYSNIRDKFFLSKNSSGLAYSLSLYTDELDYLGTSTNDLYLNTINADNNSSRLWWDNAYQSIYTINAFINGVSQSSAFEKQIKNQLLGEAYTLRALHYQYLIQLYGDIPYTTSTDYIFNTSIYKTPYHLALIEIEKDFYML
ncbi:RagB/SusD family nutrient uptake outer membrane protein [Myroides fluvii]|uniref:RagB/SusD family nutrient uptake outer membrane protein n=1 Tax=Myroides fluvii TaxID=2572594 RepID=UPI001E36EB7D|nr:RagB/SusD family nutrient uptake outer membrane protein [Myroides fluvii]